MTRPGPTLANPAWRALLIFALYAYQGLVAGLSLTALPNHYAGLGASPEAIGGHLAIAALPWALQPLWGPVVDRFGTSPMGRRRAWVVAAMAASLAALSLLLAVDDAFRTMRPVSLIFMAHSAFAALLDTAADGMIIDRVPRQGLGRANAWTRAGFVSGAALGAGLFGWLLPAHGLATAAAVLLALGALAFLAPLLIREAVGDAWLPFRPRPAGQAAAGPPASFRRLVRRLLVSLRRRETLALLALCVAMEFAVGAFQLRLGLGLIQAAGWDPAALSRLQGGITLASGTLGALLVGWWSDRAGPGRALAALLAASAAAHAATGALLAAGTAGPWAVALTGGVSPLVFVALAPAVMQASRGAAAATEFALFMAALNLGGIAGAAASGAVGAGLPPWQVALAAAAVLGLCATVAARPRLIFRQRGGAVLQRDGSGDLAASRPGVKPAP